MGMLYESDIRLEQRIKLLYKLVYKQQVIH